MWLPSVQYDLQHDFAWMAEEADHLAVLALLQIAFSGTCDDQGLGPPHTGEWPLKCAIKINFVRQRFAV